MSACCCAVNVGEDCPVFDGLFEFCQLSVGGSVGELILFKCCSDVDHIEDSERYVRGPADGRVQLSVNFVL